LFLARDRIGKKPLYYYFNGKIFSFGSEIKSILEDPVVPNEINYEAVYDYFKYQYVPDPKTIYKNIFKLRPGHCMTCSKEGIVQKEYWDVSFGSESNGSIESVSDQLLDILNESVQLRMISDVPLGAFLSGGIDSSCIVALMARQKESPVTTCSIGFGSEQFDEIPFARKVARLYSTDHHEFTVKNKAEGILLDLAYYFDEPFADSSAVPTYYVCKLAREKVIVALSGDGGDENFAGYEKYYLDDVENRIRNKIPAWLRKTVFPFLSKLAAPWDATLIRRGHTLLNSLRYEPDYGYYLTNSHFDDHLWSLLITPETKNKIGDYDPFCVTQQYFNQADTDNHLSKILYTDLKTYLAGDILVKVDRMSMANSLEVRAPILDHKLIEFSATIPAHLKYNRGEKKYVLKHACRQLLPDDILYRKKKGFSVPLSDWFHGELKALTARTLFSKNSGVSCFFKQPELEKIWQIHQSGKRDYSDILWSLLMFEFWHQNFMQ
jgi:asparagine synthase (glutamine-hydrolysing)